MYLVHYGTPQEGPGDPHGSGRYREGSGENPFQHQPWFVDTLSDLVKMGLTEKQQAEYLNMSTTELRQRRTISKDQKEAEITARARILYDKGYSYNAIAKGFGVSPTTIKKYLNPVEKARQTRTDNVADIIRKSVDKQGIVDVGKYVNEHMGVSESAFKGAVRKLRDEGYSLNYVRVKQGGTNHFTNIRVLCKPGTNWYDAQKDPSLIKEVVEYSRDNGKTFETMKKPTDVDRSRLEICYAEDGGGKKDGVIELRRGVADLSLGNSRYAQVRISIDGTHYLKGMAVYADDLPEGKDIRFNTGKSKEIGWEKALKPQKDDPANPFGASIKRQATYVGEDGKEHLSALNIVNEEGEWRDSWSNSLAAQMLSKQPAPLAKKQLDATYKIKQQQFEEIKSLTNAAVREKLLAAFADECDSDAVHLKAAAMPRQGWHVILPAKTLKDNEIYAPNFKDGETVVLIRYPHGGRFEIPTCTVNNKNKEAKAILGDQPKDAVCVSAKTAQQLSGADFDGDTVLVIPNNNGAIKTKPYYEALKNFDHMELYKAYPDMPEVGKATGFIKGQRMGDITNLITDMTIKDATDAEIIRAVKHSMVIIDAEKHNLNWRQSYKDNGIAELKKKYQGRVDAGASTLISRSTSQEHPRERKQGVPVTDPVTGKTRYQMVDPETGQKLFRETGAMRPDPKKYVIDEETKQRIVTEWGEKPRTTKTTKMAYTLETYGDARLLSSGTDIEEVYAAHANRLHDLANQARKENLTVDKPPVNKEAQKKYAKEVAELDDALHEAHLNAPLERQAQALMNHLVKAREKELGYMDADDKKKLTDRCLKEARARVGAGKKQIKITDRQWEAIQAGAVSYSKQKDIFNNANQDRVRELATPKREGKISSSQLSRAKSMLARGYTQAEVADSLGVSVSTLMRAVNE